MLLMFSGRQLQSQIRLCLCSTDSARCQCQSRFSSTDKSKHSKLASTFILAGQSGKYLKLQPTLANHISLSYLVILEFCLRLGVCCSCVLQGKMWNPVKHTSSFCLLKFHTNSRSVKRPRCWKYKTLSWKYLSCYEEERKIFLCWVLLSLCILVWILHDRKYHVPFALACQTLRSLATVKGWVWLSIAESKFSIKTEFLGQKRAENQ